MTRIIGTALALCVLAGCKDTAPTAANIEEGYKNLAQVNVDRAIERYGSESDIPSMELGFIKMTAQVELTNCEKATTDLGWLCIYNVVPINQNNEVLADLKASDVRGRVYEGALGWMVEELPVQ